MFRFITLIAAGALAVLPSVVHSIVRAAQGRLKPNLEDPCARRVNIGPSADAFTSPTEQSSRVLVQPVIQYYAKVGGIGGHALVAGLRTQVDF
jgi:hypothetical protein